MNAISSSGNEHYLLSTSNPINEICVEVLRRRFSKIKEDPLPSYIVIHSVEKFFRKVKSAFDNSIYANLINSWGWCMVEYIENQIRDDWG